LGKREERPCTGRGSSINDLLHPLSGRGTPKGEKKFKLQERKRKRAPFCMQRVLEGGMRSSSTQITQKLLQKIRRKRGKKILFY